MCAKMYCIAFGNLLLIATIMTISAAPVKRMTEPQDEGTALTDLKGGLKTFFLLAVSTIYILTKLLH